MPATSKLLLPCPELAGLIAAAIYRDTRGVTLGESDRMNYFPATPHLTVTRVFAGQLHARDGICDLEALRATDPLPMISMASPKEEPSVSWSPGGMAAMTVALYPNAWAQLTGQPGGTMIPGSIRDALEALDGTADIAVAFERFCTRIAPVWRARRRVGPFSGWAGSDKVADWVQHVLTASLVANRDSSPRSIERVLRRWTGTSRRSLEFYARIEMLHRTRQRDAEATLADTALDAGFSDQSHMGRNLKRATGFSPATLNRRIETEEPFWCYRLLGDRF